MTTSKKTSPYAREVAKELLLLGAIEFNVDSPFTWVSGIKSPIYCDNRKVISNVRIRTKFLNFFHNFIKIKFPDVEIIAGVATGGMPLGILIADSMKLPFIYVRQEPKKHGLMRQVEGSFRAGDKVVLIEDHISTGGSSFKAIQGLWKEKLEMLGIISILSYGFNKAENLFSKENINHLTLCDLDTIVDVAYDIGKISIKDKESILAFRNNLI